MEKHIALVGAGQWGKNHLKNLAKLGALHSVLETSDQIIASRKEEFPKLNYTKDEQDILTNPAIRGVVIAAPAEYHFQIAKKFLIAGKDVLVEKPLALKVQEGEELNAIAKAHNRILMVGHILQYHSAVMKLKELIDIGELGEIRYIYSNRLNIGKLRTEENVLWSFAPHDISIILMMMNGQEPKRVEAFGGSYITRGIFDTTLTSLEFENGVKSHIFVSWLHPYKEQKLIVVGSKKMALFNDVSQEKLLMYPHSIKYEEGRIPVAQKADHYVVKFEQNQPLEAELKHFIECIATRETPKTDGEEGLKVLKILDQAQQKF